MVQIVLSEPPSTIRKKMAAPEQDLVFPEPRRLACSLHQTFSVTRTGLFGWGSLPAPDQNLLAIEREEKERKKHGAASELFVAEPLQVDFFRGLSPAEVSCGLQHTMVLEKPDASDCGVLWAFGNGSGGRLGVGELVGAGEKGASSSSSTSTGGLEESSTSEPAFGATLGADGAPPSDPFFLSVPTKVTLGAVGEGLRIGTVCAGSDHTLAVTEFGEVLAWGLGHFGQLGNGSTRDVWTPTEVFLFTEFFPTVCYFNTHLLFSQEDEDIRKIMVHSDSTSPVVVLVVRSVLLGWCFVCGRYRY